MGGEVMKLILHYEGSVKTLFDVDSDLSNFMDMLEVTTTNFKIPPDSIITLQYMTPSNSMKVVANDKDLMDMFKDHVQVGCKVIHIYSHRLPIEVVGSSQLTSPNIPTQFHHGVASDEESDGDYHEDEEDHEDDLLFDEDRPDVSEEENVEDDDIYTANVDSSVEDYEVEESIDKEEHGFWKGNEDIEKALCVGMKFPCKKDYGMILHDYSIKMGVALKKVWNDKRRIAHRCAFEDCKWRIYAAVLRDGTTIQIRTMQAEHSCPRTSNNPFATSAWLAEKIGDKLRDDREKSAKVIMREVQRDYGVAMSCSQVYRAKRKAIEGSRKDQYKLLPRYLEAIVKWNPGSIVHLTTQSLPIQPPVFERLFVSFNSMRKGFIEGCRPFIGLDGTHLKTTRGGVLLSAIALDANQGIFPVGLAIVEIEDQHSWGWFLQLLQDTIEPWQHQALNFISSRQKGLLNAFDRVMPGVRHRFCVRHLYKNFKAKYPGRLLKNALWSASNAFNEVEFKKHMEELRKSNSEAFNWLSTIPDWAWSRHAFARHTKAQENVNNLCKSFNNWIRVERDISIITLMESIRNKWMKKIRIRYGRMVEHKGKICPNIQKKLENTKIAARQGDLTPIGNEEFEVTYHNYKYVVNLNQRTCTCGEWDLTGLPCKHAMKAIIYQRVNPEDYCDDFFTKEAFLRSYGHIIHPMPDEKYWPPSDRQVEPPPRPKKIGRPKKACKKGPDEHATNKNPGKISLRSSHFCKICNQPNHNRRKCPLRPRNEEGQSSQQFTLPKQQKEKGQPKNGKQGHERQQKRQNQPQSGGQLYSPDTQQPIQQPSQQSIE
ncbi:uncharacterized protein LOC122671178 [Telopea speciosissima]|uniref:uncharacterized protein LOC122671178 n=1 Tax=Telopea speciosissima TaxID=54955 RepID=UPI001CC53A7D|nr:uncharacterized protein LOC122671178 [Telopea speciosissima]